MRFVALSVMAAALVGLPIGVAATPAAGATASPAGAFAPLTAQQAPVMFNGFDVTEFVEFAKHDLREVTTPFTLYHWDKSGQHSSWSNITSPHDPAFAQMIRNAAPTPFRTLGPHGVFSEMYGAGFYLAVDPVATRSYGGGLDEFDYEKTVLEKAAPDQNWQLVQLTLPIGFRFLDLAEAQPFTPAVRPILDHFGCKPPQNSADGFFVAGGTGLTAECADFVRFVYQTTFAIDAIAYRYESAKFAACEAGLKLRPNDDPLAFVITNGQHIESQNVTVWHSQTTDEFENRKLLESLFYFDLTFQGDGILNADATEKAIARLQADNPGASIQLGRLIRLTTASLQFVYACPIGTKFSDPDASCSSQIALLPATVTDILSSTTSAPYGLLSPDLEDQRKSSATAVEAFLKVNRLGCDGTARYKSL